ncbi:MAG: hypothetical protein M1459_01360 [Patescibacteria group bacterium]|nr:hypothetical protein [Patescibacteria group bacterium]
MPDKELIIFDLDGTLAPSKSPLESTMAGLLFRLLAKKKVAVISGGRFAQFETQFLAKLPHGADNMTNMIILPTSGIEIYYSLISESYVSSILSTAVSFVVATPTTSSAAP